MKVYNNMLIILLVFSLFQCSNTDQQNTTNKAPSELNSTNESSIPQEAEMQSVPTTTVQENEPSITIDPSKIKSAVTNVSLQAPQTISKTEDAPTVIEFKPTPIAMEVSPQVSQPSAPVIQQDIEVVAVPDHAIFDAFLQKAVNRSGQVNYNTIKSNSTELDAYISELSNHPPDKSWSRNSAMAYWINAYNAFTLKLVADNYPISSIKDLHNGNPWIVKWIKLNGKSYSLDQIENEILRPLYGDARIHFAVNCAAKSCPPLHNRAFTEANLNSKLNSLTRNFINNKNYNTISSDQLRVSQIFNWYAKDFGTLTEYINRYTDTDINADATIEYQEYDWSLNN